MLNAGATPDSRRREADLRRATARFLGAFASGSICGHRADLGRSFSRPDAQRRHRRIACQTSDPVRACPASWPPRCHPFRRLAREYSPVFSSQSYMVTINRTDRRVLHCRTSQIGQVPNPIRPIKTRVCTRRATCRDEPPLGLNRLLAGAFTAPIQSISLMSSANCPSR